MILYSSPEGNYCVAQWKQTLSRNIKLTQTNKYNKSLIHPSSAQPHTPSSSCTPSNYIKILITYCHSRGWKWWLGTLWYLFWKCTHQYNMTSTAKRPTTVSTMYESVLFRLSNWYVTIIVLLSITLFDLFMMMITRWSIIIF